LQVPADSYHGEAKPARAFVRPFDLDIATDTNGHPYFRATIRHINAAGAVVKVALENEYGETVHVELPQERYRMLSITNGSLVFVTPREVKVFVDDYSI
jgi:sulfate transport system ATP-binding protein